MKRPSCRLENFADKNKEHFDERGTAFINFDFETISEKREQLRIMGLKTVMDIRQTFKALEVLKRRIKGLKRRKG
jgi:hypothetical protein